MSDHDQSAEISKKMPIAALIMSFLSIGLLIFGRLINMTSSAPAYSSEAEFNQHLSTGIIVAFALVSLVGLLLSIIALVKALRKPAVYGGKGLAIAALILNGIFSLISAGVIFILLPYAISYSSNR